ncbi:MULTISPECIES: hypothetical protein [Burkholderia]|uniref:Uncharacterized protein n=1 Tax=Burkholderia mayonis TaxID=1385591 RepID=A0A1B4FPJ4_9BURK|nr:MULTISPECIES: hypothetical protein [Burkholderia]AOJ05590.1 hypothetical protein WS70_28465 [Burkholderia mayonis]KVE34697.1 hypothetical protein WS69_16100 [Burkholderia sp. BDU5]KVE43979.1 hypothetical protein WS70_08465 [Burkholderia mayonis]
MLDLRSVSSVPTQAGVGQVAAAERNAGRLDVAGTPRTVARGGEGDIAVPHPSDRSGAAGARDATLTEDVASRQIVNAFRQFITGKSHGRMIESGEIWKDVPAQNARDHVRDLSKANLRGLYRELGALSGQEKQFVERFLATPFFATHSTAAPVKSGNDTVSLFSRQKLIDRHIIFNQANSPQEDIKLLGNDDFVFFSLEAGADPKKPSSRFGGTTYRFDFDDPHFRDTAWLSLVEMRFARTPNLDRHIEGLSPDEYSRLSKRTLQPFQTVFAGGDMKAGIALSIVRDMRENLSPDAQARVLGNVGEAHVNKLVNGLYRPEIKVARHFFSNQYMEVAVKKDDKF